MFIIVPCNLFSVFSDVSCDFVYIYVNIMSLFGDDLYVLTSIMNTRFGKIKCILQLFVRVMHPKLFFSNVILTFSQ